MDSPSTRLHLFNENHYVRSSWIAFFTLWALWGLSYFLRHITVQEKDQNVAADTEANTPNPNTTNPNTTNPNTTNPNTNKGWKNIHNSLSDKLRSSHEVLLENTLLLLSVLILNTFAGGTTRGVMVLCWVFFAFTLVNALTEVGINHHFIRLGFNIVFYGVTLAIGGLSFYHQG
ncbi:hypothetical protein EDC94DRAFT_362289 [Helicostylum pulchrum]|nr:hypothetical protein EDC94DRAFT_362289 [Helicostylum pulchrum]